MESRDRRRTREQTNPDKTRKKTTRDKPPEYIDKDSTLPVDTETVTISSHPEDSEFSERFQQRNENRRVKEKSQHKMFQEQRISNHEQRNNHDRQVNKIEEIEESDKNEKSEKEKPSHRRHEKPQSDETDKKRSKLKAEHKSSKEHKEHREGRRERHRSEEKRNREGYEGHQKSRETYHIKSKSIAEKLDQLDLEDYSDEEEEMENKELELNYTPKQSSQKENEEGEEDEDDNDLSKHNHQKEKNEERKKEEADEGKLARPTKRHHSVKGKTSLRDKLKRSVPENRENVIRRSDESEQKKKQRKRTESHRDQKKEKSCKKCKKHICKPDPQRAYFSDSELDCGNGASRSKSFEGNSSRNEPPLDVNAMYQAFTHSTRSKTYTEESEKNKDSTKQKEQNMKKSETLLCEKCKKGAKPSKRTRSPTEQTSIRSKLITALFQRIKALLKETEELRQERNDLKEKLSNLTKEYEILRGKKDDINSEQEQLMNEKIETLAGDIRIPNKGTFREEVHQILQNIQKKYQTHWKEHEHKINQVQTDAENEIQSLMRNIVTKYVEIGEIKDRNEMATNMLQSKNMAEPLYISTKTNSNPEMTTRNQTVGIYEKYYPNTVPSKNELLLKVADHTKPRSSNQQPNLQALCRENILKANSQPPIFRHGNPMVDMNIEKPPRELANQREISMIPKFLHTNSNKYQHGNTETLMKQNNGNKTDQLKEKLPLPSLPEDIKVNFHPTTTSEEVKMTYRTKKLFPSENKPITENISKPIEQGFLTKKDTREFWRQKLSQPVLETCKEIVDNHRPLENKRNVN